MYGIGRAASGTTLKIGMIEVLEGISETFVQKEAGYM
jgi:hypothetical protein